MKELKEKGITLIVLVVTIIILLILAGVTISQLSGDNGLFSKVRESVEKYKDAQDDEKIAVEQLESLLINSGTDENEDKEWKVANREEVLQGKVYYTKDGEPQVGTMKEHETVNAIIKAGESYKLEEGHYVGGIIKAEENSSGGGTSGGSSSGGQTATTGELKDRLRQKDVSAIGKKIDITNLNLPEEAIANKYKWQILYADESSIYIITTNVIAVDDCPQKNGSALTKGSEYTAGFNGAIYQAYSGGSKDITDPNLIKLNSNYYMNGYVSDKWNMRCVAYLLDKEIWNQQFLGASTNDKVNYVVGCPSVELILNAYNAYNGTSYGARAISEVGYSVSKTGTDNYETNINVMIQNLDGTYNTAICIHDKDVDGEERKISFLWLSSPCSYSQSNVMITNSNGAVYSTLYSQTDCGFRPIISLASTVQLEEQEDGSFKIL